MVQITIPQVSLENLLLRRANRFVCGAGEHRMGGNLELLYRSVSSGQSRRAAVRQVLAEGLNPVLISTGRRALGAEAVEQCLHEAGQEGAKTTAVLSLVEREGTLEVFGLVEDGLETKEIDVLWIPGAGMEWVTVMPFSLGERNGQAEASDRQRRSGGESPLETSADGTDAASDPVGEFIEERLTRLAGVLGEDVLRRAQELRVLLVGGGRAISVLKERLVQSGVGRIGGLIIADSDDVELHNLDVMRLPVQAVGLPKAYALAAMEQVMVPGSNVIPLVATLSDQVVADAFVSSDFIFSAVDNDAARVGAAVLAATYLKPHLDMTGGAAHVGGADVAVGGELRLFCPGCRGCVACFGNESPEQALAELSRSREEDQAQRREADWRVERPGSWGDALLPVVGEAVQVFFRLLQGRRRQSLWWHYYHNENDLPVWENWTSRAHPDCPICSGNGLQGLGDPRE